MESEKDSKHDDTFGHIKETKIYYGNGSYISYRIPIMEQHYLP